MSEAEYSSAAARPRRDGRSLRELFGAELALHGITWCRGGRAWIATNCGG